MERRRRTFLWNRRYLDSPPDLWQFRVAVRPKMCSLCRKRFELGEAEAWHVASMLYFHLGCTGALGSQATTAATLTPRFGIPTG
jgi:hypothetical protein